MTSPHAPALAADSARAALLGYQPSSSATARMRRRVASASPGRLFSAKDTAPLETPARRAISAMVTRLVGIRASGTAHTLIRYSPTLVRLAYCGWSGLAASPNQGHLRRG